MNKDFPEFVEIGILQQRKIEAEIIKPIYEIMKREFGLDKAKSILINMIIMYIVAVMLKCIKKWD